MALSFHQKSHSLLFFTLLLCCAGHNCLAQHASNLPHLDLTVPRFYAPSAAVSPSVRTYQVSVTFSADTTAPALLDNDIPAFLLPHLAPVDTNPDLQVLLTIKGHKITRTGKKRLNPDKSEAHWFEAEILPLMEWTAADVAAGKVAAKTRSILPQRFVSPEFPTLEMANRAFEQPCPEFKTALKAAYVATLGQMEQSLLTQLGYRPQTIRFYLPSENHLEFEQAIARMEPVLSQKNQIAISDLQDGLQPTVAFFEQVLATARLKHQPDRVRFLASALNLIQIFQSTHRTGKAMAVEKLLQEEGFGYVSDYILPYQEYVVNTPEKIKILHRTTPERVGWLAKQTRNKGYILLANTNRKVEGDILDFLPNANRRIVRLRYEKTLNTPVGDKEFSLDEVAEVHFADWHLRVLSFADEFVLGEIYYQSPQVGLYYSLPKSDKYALGSERSRDMYLVEKKAKKSLLAMGERLAVLQDCPFVNRLWELGYYDSMREAVCAYDSLCFSRSAVAPAPVATASEPATVLSPAPAPTAAPAATPTSAPAPRKAIRSDGLYLGAVLGGNCMTGNFGVLGSFRLNGAWRAQAALGGGIWGAKYALGLQYNLGDRYTWARNWALEASWARSTGLRSPVGTTFKRESPITGEETEVSFEFIPKAMSTTIFTVGYAKHWGRSMKVGVDIGCAFPLKRGRYWEVVTPGIAEEDVAREMRFFQPGGLVVDVRVLFGKRR